MNYLPSFFYGFLILVVGFLLAGLVKEVFIGLVKFFKVSFFFKATNIAKEKEVTIWADVLGELLKWVVVILFLVPTMQLWGLSGMTVILNSLLLYLPNVIVSVVIALVGYVVSNLTHDIVLQSVKTVQKRVSATMATLSKYVILVFTGLVVLNQLGVAQDLIRILFTGIVFMIAIAGGLAFGLGGQTVAKEMLEDLKKKFKE
ncbi:MAG: hypothetical protein WC775_01430 [Patescibacteria group bacterium]